MDWTHEDLAASRQMTCHGAEAPCWLLLCFPARCPRKSCSLPIAMSTNACSRLRSAACICSSVLFIIVHLPWCFILGNEYEMYCRMKTQTN